MSFAPNKGSFPTFLLTIQDMPRAELIGMVQVKNPFGLPGIEDRNIKIAYTNYELRVFKNLKYIKDIINSCTIPLTQEDRDILSSFWSNRGGHNLAYCLLDSYFYKRDRYPLLFDSLYTQIGFDTIKLRYTLDERFPKTKPITRLWSVIVPCEIISIPRNNNLQGTMHPAMMLQREAINELNFAHSRTISNFSQGISLNTGTYTNMQIDKVFNSPEIGLERETPTTTSKSNLKYILGPNTNVFRDRE
jgi:hypothetical protein